MPGQVDLVAGGAEHARPVMTGIPADHVRDNAPWQGVWRCLGLFLLVLRRKAQDHEILKPAKCQFRRVCLLAEGLQPAQVRCV
jgi:hypothetical protein